MTLWTSGPDLSVRTLVTQHVLTPHRETETYEHLVVPHQQQPTQDAPTQQQPEQGSSQVIEILKTLGILAEWQKGCTPLGCKALHGIDPLHVCNPTGAWNPTPISRICSTESGLQPGVTGVVLIAAAVAALVALGVVTAPASGASAATFFTAREAAQLAALNSSLVQQIGTAAFAAAVAAVVMGEQTGLNDLIDDLLPIIDDIASQLIGLVESILDVIP